jgi:site-specific recombinase XerD
VALRGHSLRQAGHAPHVADRHGYHIHVNTVTGPVSPASHNSTSGAPRSATINRKFAALKSFFRWAQGAKHIAELSTESVKGVQAQLSPPRWLDKRQVDRLLRAVERHGNKRDLAVLQTLRHTGIRAGELVSIRLRDIDLSERKGELRVWARAPSIAPSR